MIFWLASYRMPALAVFPGPTFKIMGFLMKRFLSLCLILSLASSLAWAATPATTTQGILTSVNGKVQIKNKSGKKTRIARKDSSVVEGERIVTAQDAKATLQLFDGSELAISPKTDFQLTKLQKPSGEDKILHFKLFVGRLFAKVKKLASSKSSFEVEAGGVVCGVRGTQFGLEYDPGKNKLGLGVYEGSVYTNWNGHSSFYNAGENVDFNNGQPNNPGHNGNNGGGNGQGGDNKGGGNKGGGALGDMGNQFETGLSVTGGDDNGLTGGNGNGLSGGKGNGFTDPGVEGSVHLGVQIHVAPGETVP